MHRVKTTHTILSVVVALSALSISPAVAYKWPGQRASIGGAVSAKVIGRHCKGTLTPAEIADLDGYLAKAAKEWTANHADAKDKATSFDEVVSNLSRTYEARFSSPNECNGDATEEARDSLQRVQKVMASGRPVFADDPNDRPPPFDVIRAKVVAESCRAAFTARDWAALEFDLAQQLRELAKIPNEGDARATLEVLKSIEKKTVAGWQAKECANKSTIDNARAILARVRKAAAAGAH